MKKVLVILFATLLMLSSAGAIGANDKELENTHLAGCSNPKYSDTELESGIAHSDSDHMFRQYVLRYCRTCGMEYGKELISNIKRNVVTFTYLNAERHRIACEVCDWYYDAKHIMVNGECKWCDIPESGCDHDDYTDNAYYAGKYQIEYSKITETTHDAKHPYRRTCDDCGEVLKEGHFPAVTEKHTFKNGVCACGKAEKTDCDHDDYTDDPYYAGKYTIEYSKITDTTHDAKHPYQRTCDDCGEVLKEGHFPAVTEKHTFKKGVCACGAEETPDEDLVEGKYCPVCKSKNYDDIYDGKKPIYRDEGNTHSGYYTANRTCLDCGKVFKKGLEIPVEGRQNEVHGFSVTPHWEYDEEYHWGKKTRKCAKCGFEGYTDDIKKAKHTFEDGKCTACEYKRYYETTLKWTDSVLGKKNTFDFTFEASRFTQPSTNYDQDLAILSLAMVLAVQSDGSLNDDLLNKIYSDFGFHTSGDEVYSTYTGDGINNVACTMAFREIDDDGVPYKLLAVNTRGGNYGTEWVTNFDVGSGDAHRGFAYAASTLLNNIEEFCRENGIDLYNEDVKIWVTGFSRSAAVSNYVSHWLNEKYRAAGKPIEDIFTYTFATPNNTKANGEDLTEGYENIFNIVSSDDLVPMVPLGNWGYSKYGVTMTLPEYGTGEASAMLTSLKEVTGGYYKDNRVFQNWSGQSEAVETTCDWIASVIEDTEDFDREYQAVIDDVASIIFGADKLGSIDSKGETLDKYNAAVSTAVMTKLSSVVINKVVPGLGTAVGMTVDSNFEYYDKVLDQSTGLFTDFAVEFAKLSSEEKSQIVELITGVSLDQLLLYGDAILKGTAGVIDEETTDSVMASIEKFMDVGGHIASTHRMETYLAWLLSNDADTLFGK